MDCSAANDQKVTKLIETFRLVCRDHSHLFFIAGAFFSEFRGNTHQSIAHKTLYNLVFEFNSIGRSVRPQISRKDERIKRKTPSHADNFVILRSNTSSDRIRPKSKNVERFKSYPKCVRFISINLISLDLFN